MKGRSPNKPQGVRVGGELGGCAKGGWRSEETGAGDSACSLWDALLSEKTNSSSRFISLWRRDNQQPEVAAEGDHVVWPQQTEWLVPGFSQASGRTWF